jgi:hypothetical protein
VRCDPGAVRTLHRALDSPRAADRSEAGVRAASAHKRKHPSATRAYATTSLRRPCRPESRLSFHTEVQQTYREWMYAPRPYRATSATSSLIINLR